MDNGVYQKTNSKTKTSGWNGVLHVKVYFVNDLDLRTQVAKVEYHQSPIHDF